MSDSLHCIRGCVRRGLHATDCEGGDCAGCLPRSAVIGQVCPPCHGRLANAIARTPKLIRHVRAQVQPSYARRDSMVTESRTPPAPLALTAVDDADKLYATLAAWHQTVTDELDLTALDMHGWTTRASAGQIAGLRAGGQGDDSAAIAQRLTTHLDRICVYPWVADMVTELADVVRTTSHRWPDEERPIYLPTPCPACDNVSLTRYAPSEFEGRSTISCRSCGQTLAEDMYDWQTRRVLVEKQAERAAETQEDAA